MSVENFSVNIVVFGGSELHANTESDTEALMELAHALVSMTAFANVTLYTGMAQGYGLQLLEFVLAVKEVAVRDRDVPLTIHGLSPWGNKETHLSMGDPLEGFDTVTYLDEASPVDADDKWRFRRNTARLLEKADGVLTLAGGEWTAFELAQALEDKMRVMVLSSVQGSRALYEEVMNTVEGRESEVMVDDDPHNLLAWVMARQYARQDADMRNGLLSGIYTGA